MSGRDLNWPLCLRVWPRLVIAAGVLGTVALACIWPPEHVVELTFCDAECLLMYEDPPRQANSFPEEDDSGWDCRLMGNYICGAEHQALRP